ncbi:MAG: adenylate/guanylate cyclase domain-containing protein, partial [Candidatus Nitrotoga sp.]
AAVHIQKEIDNLNMSKTFNFPVLARVGIHTGCGVAGGNDLYGDVVNTVSRFESAADWGGILLSGDTYQNLSDKSEIYCRFVKQVRLAGNAENFNAYKAFWNPLEIELNLRGQLTETQTEQQPESGGWMAHKLLLGGVISVLVTALVMAANFSGNSVPAEQHRTIFHSSNLATPSLVDTSTR